MRVLWGLGWLLLVTVLRSCAAPTENVPAVSTGVVDGVAAVHKGAPVEVPTGAQTGVPTSVPSAPPPAVGYRKETLSTVTKKSAIKNTATKTKETVKKKVKHLKNGDTVTIIKDKSRSKTKTDELTDDYSQTNHTLTTGAVQDFTSLTEEQKHQLHQVEIHKKIDKEIIVTDANGHVKSDTHKVKEKDRVRKKERNSQTKTLLHTVTNVPTNAPVGSPPVKSPPVGSPPVASPPVESPPADNSVEKERKKRKKSLHRRHRSKKHCPSVENPTTG